MGFSELCDRLTCELGTAEVFCAAYPNHGTNSNNAKWTLLIRDRIFDVGGLDRGEWFSSQKFDNENDACKYIYQLMTRKPDIWVQTPEEKQRSREISAAYNRKLGARDPKDTR